MRFCRMSAVILAFAAIQSNGAVNVTASREYVDRKVTSVSNSIMGEVYTRDETDKKIVELAKVPGNYAAVSNAAMNALSLAGGTLTGDLAVGENFAGQRKLTVASANGAAGIELLGGTSSGDGSRLTIGGSSGGGATLNVNGGVMRGGHVFVGASAGGGGTIEVQGDDASIKKGNKEVATEEQLNAKADKATTLAGYGITDAATKTELDAVDQRAANALTTADSAYTVAGQAMHDTEVHAENKENPHAVTAAQVGALPLTGGTMTGDLSIGEEHAASRKLTVAADNGANGITLQGGVAGTGSSVTIGGSDGIGGTFTVSGGAIGGGKITVEAADQGNNSGSIEVTGTDASIKKDGKEVATEAYVDEQVSSVSGTLTNLAVTVNAKVDKTDVYTKAESDARISAVSNRAEEAYSAAEDMVDAVNSLAGTIGTHIRDTNNPHKVTAAQVGALPLSGGTLTGDLAVGEEHTASRKLTVAADSGANGITLQGGVGVPGIGSSITIGGSSGIGGTLTVSGGGIGGAKITVGASDQGYDGGSIEVIGNNASIKKDGKEVATESYVDAKVENAVLPTNQTFSNAVLAVGLNIDTNSVAVLNDIAATFGGFPIEGTATTVGGLLAALAAAIAWLKKNKVGSFESVGGATATVENGVAKLDDFFTNSNSLLTGTIAANSARLAFDEDGEIIVTMNTED